jgi:hypothetical protein
VGTGHAVLLTPPSDGCSPAQGIKSASWLVSILGRSGKVLCARNAAHTQSAPSPSRPNHHPWQMQSHIIHASHAQQHTAAGCRVPERPERDLISAPPRQSLRATRTATSMHHEPQPDQWRLACTRCPAPAPRGLDLAESRTENCARPVPAPMRDRPWVCTGSCQRLHYIGF